MLFLVYFHCFVLYKLNIMEIVTESRDSTTGLFFKRSMQ
jgi:hypothetical protein